MHDYPKALAALAENEPIEWLFGPLLRDAAVRNDRHHVFDLLCGVNAYSLRAWNAWLSEFRSVLVSPDLARRKVCTELHGAPLARLDDVFAEVFAVLHLSRIGYRDFEPVVASNKKSVDFISLHEANKAMIEVKNLHEPDDVIRTIALQRWRECVAKHPERFRIRVLLNHNYAGPVSTEARSRLCNAIDQLPDIMKEEFVVTLDRDIQVTFVRLGDDNLKEPGLPFMLQQSNRVQDSQLIISTAIRAKDLEFNVSELQSLFLKCVRTLGDATGKFFGIEPDANAENILVMRWAPPRHYYDDASPLIVQQAIESAFDSVGLQLTVVILGSDPEPSPNFCLGPGTKSAS